MEPSHHSTALDIGLITALMLVAHGGNLHLYDEVSYHN
jgi:hypothetical protein